MADGFLGRWSQRKQAVRDGRPAQEVPASAEAPPAAAGSAQGIPPSPSPAAPPVAGSAPSESAVAAAPPASPPPTMDDVAALTPQSDYARFMDGAVDPEVKNAAMRKLFADPHFNVMDGLDIYIDDYNTPNPLPASMLRQMASAHFLKLFDEEEKDSSAATRVAADPTPPESAPQAQEAEVPAKLVQDHDHTDLRLQQDHAAGPQESGRGPQ